jgi:hypothetical protein
MFRSALLLAAAAAVLSACASAPDTGYHPAPQLIPGNIQKLALHPILNNTEQYVMEDKLTLDVRDQFLNDSRYPLVPEENADGVVWITITRYILAPIQFDANLVPTSYKLRVLVDVKLVDAATNGALWDERNIDASQTYADATLPNGITEEQARENIWATLAPQIVTRVIDGFGAVTGTSERTISGDAPSTAPAAQPEVPIKPVITAPY